MVLIPSVCLCRTGLTKPETDFGKKGRSKSAKLGPRVLLHAMIGCAVKAVTEGWTFGFGGAVCRRMNPGVAGGMLSVNL